MASIFRVKVNWTGFVGAPGVSVFHFSTFEGNFGPGAQGAADALTTMFDAFATYIPGDVDIRVDPEVEVLESTTGELINYVPGITTAQISGDTATAYSAASGAVVNWSTATVRNGRRMRGRTFIVPLIIGAYDTAGSLAPGVVTAMNTAVDTFLATPDVELLVYGRPTVVGNDGLTGVVTDGSVPDMAAVLRSRRD